MQQESSFQIYNASAGSGKTFTLVKEYLKILLVSDDIFIFQKVLAITFTNKAAAEMKQRVLDSLKEFSEGKTNTLFEILKDETGLEATILQKKSKKILEVILQNYAAFYITTIDSFTYKIIKSFAFDLGLSQNFEVELNAQELLDKAVEVLISRIGTNKELTDVLIEYSLDKSDEDKSWDISRDLAEFSKILLKEEDINHFRKLADKSLKDFKDLEEKLKLHQKEIKKKMISIGEEGLQFISGANLDFTDFYYSMIPKHFLGLKNNPELVKFFDQSKLKYNIKENNFYAKSKSEVIKSSIEEILPDLVKLYNDSEVLYQKLLKNRLVLKSIIPLAVLNHINQELTTIKEDNNIRLNAEFNQLISDNIQDQPAPFIYERIGQKFTHYFIDEMQDTSVLQWKNLIPLIDNSLSQENTSLMLVGDGKQAIYRWRGGKASQFIELGADDKSSKNPFLVEKDIKELDTNYRSSSEIINFNNSFFKHSSQFIQKPLYANLFSEKSHQEENENKGGYVSLSFLEKSDDKEENQLKYAVKVLNIINEFDANVSLGNVCVLVRKRSEGVTIANYLSEHHIEIVSSETLLLSNSRKVNFIVNFLKFTLQPKDKECLMEILSFVHHHFKINTEKHTFFNELIELEFLELVEALKKYDCYFDVIEYHQSPFYEKIEQIIRAFHLQYKTDAYVQFFLDEVLIQQQKEASIQDFLEYWELNKEKLSVVSSENKNAVKIMTIHKSKGLEFPIVIFPCDLNIYQDIKPKTWLENDYEEFPEFMVSLNKEIQYVNQKGRDIYDQRRTELELDSFNLLYVALTRAAEQLYIVTEKKVNKSGLEDVKYFSGLFISFLKQRQLWEKDQSEYVFGAKKLFENESDEDANQIQDTFISNPWKNHQINLLASSSKLWGTTRGEAKDYGTFIHKIMSFIYTKSDVDEVLEKFVQKGEMEFAEKGKIKKMIIEIITHSKLINYFSEDLIVYNEREIVCNNQIVIPDRLVFDSNNQVTIIDYKTGVLKEAHFTQLKNYASVLESLNFKIKNKILIYSNESITVEEF